MGNLHINYLAVLAAAVSIFALGAIWYSPVLFGNAWMKVNGFTDEDVKKINPARSYGVSFILALIIAFNLAAFLGDEKTDLLWGVTAGALAGIGWVAMGIAIIALFENRSWKYIFINAGFQVVAFIIMGAILGAWR